MLQNNPLKSDIKQMNDWEAFKEHIQHSVDKQVVSNKTVIMIFVYRKQCLPPLDNYFSPDRIYLGFDLES